MRHALAHPTPALLVMWLCAMALAPGRVDAEQARRAHYFYKNETIKVSHARIVSLAPVVTETLFELGLGPHVVGVTRFCDRPTEASGRAKVGGFVDVQLEAVLGLRPDVVVAMPSLGQRRVLDELRARGIPVAVVFADTLAEVKDLVTFLAHETGRVSDGARLVSALDARIARASATELLKGKRVVTLVGTRPFVAAGPGTYADEIVALFGATRALSSDAPAWAHLSLEALLSLRPDIILVLEGEREAATVRADLKALAPERRPLVVFGRDAVLMRPGPSLPHDLDVLERVIADAFVSHATIDDAGIKGRARP
jgi:iron complex transport system substrate-binding protein